MKKDIYETLAEAYENFKINEAVKVGDTVTVKLNRKGREYIEKGKVIKIEKDSIIVKHDFSRTPSRVSMKNIVKEEVELDEGKMQDVWQKKNAKSLSVGPFELIRGKGGVSTIKRSGKVIGDFSYDDEADNFVANIKGERAQWVGDDIDSLFTHLQKVHKEEVELDEDVITLEDTQDFHEEFGYLAYSIDENDLFEAEYQGRKVKLNKPMRGDVKKFKVYVKDPKTGNVKKVNFGHGGTSAKRPTMRIRKSNPKARKSFRARHNCDNPGPKTKARYWSCRKW
jgi:hypothetical protein